MRSRPLTHKQKYREIPEILRIFLGMGLVAIMHFLAFFIGSLILGIVINTAIVGIAANVAIFSIFGIGVAQLIYIIPLIIYLALRKAWALMKGVIIGAILTVLLNGWGWFLLYTVSY